MLDLNQRFTILTFPQFFDGNILKVNIVFLPRNQNPLQPAIQGEGPTIPDAPPFADANLRFVAKVVSDDGASSSSSSSSSSLPTTTSSQNVMVPLNTLQPSNARRLFEALATQFRINNKNAYNTNLSINTAPHRAPDPVPKERSVKKYLPVSYRKSFNFVAPRTPNAVIDDSYHCEMRDSKPNKDFVQSPDEISWGQVFAYAMRQPLLAYSLGMVFETELAVNNQFFSNGGWLYVDLADDSDYKAQQNASGDFIKIYAARIPHLKQGVARSVFAAVQFPVLPVAPSGNYDEIFIECANYDDGFAKVLHSFQPVSNNMLQEESDGFHPTKEVGIRLGWDDEQILIWYMRQLMEDSSVGSKKRIDAPIGVFGFKIDVREKSSSNLPQQSWQSLNLVQSRDALKIVNLTTSESIILGSFMKELAYQVYPSQLPGSNKSNKSFWLPMYFANWNGKSMVLPDDDAVKIYHNDQQDVLVDPSTNVKGAYSNGLNKIYQAGPLATELQYGKQYEFRVRLSDLSGGGPSVDADPIYKAQSQIATCHFKRFIAPNAVRLDNALTANSDDEKNYFRDSELRVRRPLLGYPSVLFTGKYANAVDRLKQASADMEGEEAFGISDPDVESIEIAVEVAGLKMDNLKSISGRESYLFLYSTTRKFPTNSGSFPSSPSFDDLLTVPLQFKDCNVLNFDNPSDLGDLGVSKEEIDSMDKLILPTARTIRLTIRAVCEKRSNYYGLEGNNPDNNTRYGKTIQFLLYKPSKDERNLFANTSVAKKMQGIYLRPDPTWVHDSNPLTRLIKNDEDNEKKTSELIQRLAQQLGLENSGMTLTGKKGERVQFGCSNRIRHTLSPDNSSITFGSKGDLTNHWLCCITLQIERDWSWDALQDRSFVIKRKKRFKDDDENTETEFLDVGDIEMKKTVSFNALQKPERSKTTLVFIDAVEAKNELRQPPPNDSIPRFPDLIELEYNIETFFKQDHATMHSDSDLSLQLELPITVPPSQVPKIVSAGIALSPYIRNKKYSATEPRSRFLWIEFEEPVRDPKDNYFARVLTYAPDQLISNNHPELLKIPEEPALPIDPEYIRVITPNQPHDNMGIDAMQPMERATNSDRHYLLPLPPGLHPESPEMFGFFTYEFRMGHYKFTDTSANHSDGEYVWTTAQGRFGRALRISGIQHPAPTLTCIVNRDEEKLYVTAPYAVAVSNGKDVTANPPRTDIWCLLYAQVSQADNKDFRNVLLDDKILDWSVRVEYKKEVNWNVIYTDEQRAALKQVAIRNWKDEIDYGNFRHVYKLAESESINKDSSKYGTVIWSNNEVTQLLDLYGLPHDSSLSVLCVELLPQITDIYEHVSNLDRREVRSSVERIQSNLVGDAGSFSGSNLNEEELQQLTSRRSTTAWVASFDEKDKPLSNKLGHYRILRTSPLTEVPFICCVDCGS